MKPLIICLLAVSALLSACDKGELPVTKKDRGKSVMSTVYLGPYYRDQVWYKLNGNKIVSTNPKTDWDIAFESGDKDNHILMNSAKFMFAWNTHKANMSDVKDTIGFAANKQCDRVASLDSIVMGIFESTKSPVFIVDLGVDEMGTRQGIRKLQFVENATTFFRFDYANIDGSDLHSVTLNKNNNYNYLYYSLRDSILKTNIEPEKNQYDLLFSQYTYVFENPYQPYLLTGVLLNSSNVRATLVKGKSFDSITLADTLQHPLTSKKDEIGWDWKSYDITGGTGYTVHSDFIYIIEDAEGYFYKLRFLDFYNQSHQEGYPKFEFIKL
jgi:hypothetical protein